VTVVTSTTPADDPGSAVAGYQLAQANVAYAIADHGDPRLADYMARLDEINQLADRSPGFVWRYLTDSRDPAQREFDDPRVLFNMSVWESIDALHVYTYRTMHAEVYAARRQWFVDHKAVVGGHALAMWWVPRGERPTVADARARLALIAASGPSPRAFSFKHRVDPPSR
jgi:heme-degrading monooxygenase HmoA